MKLVIIIPALNEAATISDVITSIPRDIPGIAAIEVLVVDDGSTDETAKLAEAAGAKVTKHIRNLGVGMAFQSGIKGALDLGADIVVNIDADGQFNSNEIPRMVKPIVDGKADFVSASRFKEKSVYPDMTFMKFWGNKMMSLLISLLSWQKFYDVSCGFRAYSREALFHLNVVGKFTYTQETFLNLSYKGLQIQEVPMLIQGTRTHGESRVANNLMKYGIRTAMIILRSFRDYHPLYLFGTISASLIALTFAYVLFYIISSGTFFPHRWSKFVAIMLFALGCLTMVTGLVADMLDRIRINQERILYQMRKNYYESRKRRKNP